MSISSNDPALHGRARVLVSGRGCVVNDVAGMLAGTVQLDSGVVVTMTGDIDMLTAPYFRTLVDEAISVGAGTVTVNLAGVTFMNSWGLTVLVDAVRELNNRGRQLVLEATPAPVRRLLRITHLTELLGGVAPPSATRGLDLIPLARAGGGGPSRRTASTLVSS